MNKDDLYSIDKAVSEQIQDIGKLKELEIKKYIEGMQDGADLMTRAIRNFLNEEERNGGAK